MDTNALRWFQQVADGTTVTEVSELEGVTQPGVSRALARLERAVGAPLLHRSGRILRMTRAGAIFKRHVDAVLHELDDGIAAVSRDLSVETGTVSLAFQGTLGTWFVPELLASFRALHPLVRFELRQVHDETAASLLGGGEADLLITTSAPTSGDLRWRPLQAEPLCLAVISSHSLAGTISTEPGPTEPIDLREASNEPFVTLRSTYRLRQLTEELCRDAGFTPTIAFEGDDVSTVIGLVAAGLGVAIVPSHYRGLPESLAVNYRPLTDAGALRTIGIAWSAKRPLTPANELFRQHVMANAGRVGHPHPST
jgi:LysR family transcriptional activator of glutamate synthase operon